MIKVFIPEIKGRHKTDVRGFWYSKDTKKTFYDYLKVEHHSFCNPDSIAKEYKQEAIFYSKDNQGRCYNYITKLTEYLEHRIYSEVEPKNLKAEIKQALTVYGGITIYKVGKTYFKEIFYK